MRTATLLLLLLTAFVVTGCGAPNVVGTYKMKFEMPEEKKDDPAAAMAKSFAEGMASSMSLEMKADKTYTFSIMGQAQNGTYEVSGNTVTLNAPQGQTGAPGKFTIEDGGNTLVPVPEAGKEKETEGITFVKS